MNSPAANKLSIAEIPSIDECKRYATPSPRNAVNAVRKFKNNAFFFEKPPCISTPKSPISCGIS